MTACVCDYLVLLCALKIAPYVIQNECLFELFMSDMRLAAPTRRVGGNVQRESVDCFIACILTC
jgi:hypothetical protein